jgi:hypothetical protein
MTMEHSLVKNLDDVSTDAGSEMMSVVTNGPQDEDSLKRKREREGELAIDPAGDDPLFVNKMRKRQQTVEKGSKMTMEQSLVKNLDDVGEVSFDLKETNRFSHQ